MLYDEEMFSVLGMIMTFCNFAALIMKHSFWLGEPDSLSPVFVLISNLTLLLTVAPFSDMYLKEGFRNMSGCDGVKSGKLYADVLSWKVFFKYCCELIEFRAARALKLNSLQDKSL